MNASRRLSLIVAAVFFPLFAFAATSEVRVLFDVDNNVATGCTVGAMTGVDQVLVTQIVDSPTGASVTQTHRLVCSSGILGSPTDIVTTGWPAGWQPSSGMMLVETRIPFAALGSSSMPNEMRVGFDGTRGAASFSVVTEANGDPILFPIKVNRRRAVGFDEPRMIILDGLDPDWGMINALTHGSAGGGASAIKLINAFGFANPLDSFAYFRFDLNLSGSGILAVDDSFTRLQGSNLTKPAPGVLANDQPNTLPLTAAPVSSPSHGSVTLNPDGSFTYTPTSASSLTTDSFEYKAVSGSEESNVAKVTIKVSSTNSEPHVVPATFAVNENSPNGTAVGTVVVTDPDAGDDHTWLIQSGNTGNAFAINATTGAITVNNSSALNFEVKSQYTLVVKVTDDGNPSKSDTGPITINVNNVNDAPVAVDDGYNVAEEGTLNVAAPGVLGNDTDEDVPHSLTAALVLGPAHAASFALNPNGSFNYTPSADYVGSDSFTYQANDGSLLSNVATVTITITAVNDPPSFLAGTNQTVNEDSGPQTVPGWATAISPGPANESSQNVSFVIDNNTNTALFSGQPSVAPNGTLTYTPAANANGSATITLHAVDDGPSPGVNASGPQSFMIIVDPVNDPPTFSLGGNQTVNEDAGLQTVAGFASSISVGPADESGQTITAFNVSNDNNALFSGQPSIAPNGTLTYTPAADAFGTATVSVTATDSGGATSSPAQTFSIIVNAVNDEPSFTIASDPPASNEDAGAQTVNGFATAISRGPANESGQALTFNVSMTGSTGGLTFSSGPAIDASGNLTYTATANANGTATFNAVLTDDGSNTPPNDNTSATASFTITVNAVNDPPSFVLGGNQTVSEDAGLQTMGGFASSISVGPANESAQTITSFNVTNDNNGLFIGQPSIATNGTLTYTPAPNAFGSALVSVTATDSGGATSSPAQTFTITVSPINDAPVVTAGGTLNYTENQPATAIDGTITVTDVDSANLVGATVQITGNYVNGQDVLSFVNTPNITGNFVAATGTLTLAGTDTLANYQTALRNVLYVNTSDNPSTSARTVSWQGNDGAGVNNLSAVVTSTINVAAANDAPVVNAAASAGYTEGTGPQVIDNTLTVTDADSTQISGATVQISANYVNGEDILAFVNIPPITGNFVAASGTLTLTGTDTVANYQAALRTVTYQNTSSNPSIAPRTVTWTVTDTAAAPGSDTTTINITPVNSAPVLTAGGTLNYTENDPATVIDNTVTVTDADTPNLTSATVTLTTNYQNGQDVLSFATMFGIVGNFVPATGTLTLTGSTTPANWQTALRAVKYNNTSDNPSTLARTVQWQIDDGEAISNLSNTPTSTINVAAVNDPPTVNAGGPLAYTEGDGAVVIDSTVTVADLDDATLPSASVQITGNYVNGEDVLSFTNAFGITGNFVAATGTLNLTGPASPANFQNALRTVRYQNTSEGPSGLARTLTWTVNDAASSGTDTSVINVTPVNDAPVLSTTGTLNYSEGNAAANLLTSANITDVDDVNMESATIQITGNYANGQDVLSFVNTPNITGNFVAASGTLTLTGPDTKANYITALQNVKYNNTSEAPSTLARTVSWFVNDGNVNSNTTTSTINVTATNDAPVNSLPGPQSTNEDTPLTLTGATKISVSDVDANPDNVQVTLNVTLGTVTLNPGAIGALANLIGNGTSTVVATGTVANVNAALDGLTFNPTPNGAGAGSIQVVTDDLGHNPSGALSDTDTLTITVNPINDAPVLSVTGTLNYTENQPATALLTSANITDVDDVNMESATIQITGNYQNGADVLSFVNTPNITGNFVAASGTLTLTGTDTLANYITALQNVKYASTSENPSALQRTVTWTVNDGSINSNSPTSTINVTNVNDPPTINAGDLAYTEDAGPVVIDSTLTANDVDDATLPSATVQLTTNYVNGQDILAFVNAFGITGNFVAASGTLTLTGPASPANFQSALRTVTYQNTSNTPSTATRTVIWTLNDSAPSSGTDTTSITVTATNDTPVLTVTGTLSYTEGDPATNAATSANITDADDTNMESATIQITTNYQNGQDVLSFVNTPNISGNFVAASGTLNLTGTDTLANYIAALQAVKYNNTSENPSTLARTLTWRVNDGDINSNAQTTTVNVTAVNDPPVNAPPTNPQSVNEDTALNFTGAGNTVSVSDVDLGAGTISVQIVTTNGTTTIVTPGAVVFSGGANGSASYTITGTLAQVNSALGTLRFDPTLNFPGAAATGVATVQLVTNDNGNTPAPPLTDNDTFNITVNQVNDPPVAGDDAFDTIGNTELRIDLAAGTTPNVPETTGSGTGVRDDDSDPVEGNAFTVTSIVGCGDVAAPYDCTLPSGSTLSMNANGTFTYTPSPTIVTGAPATESFDYVITDQPAAGTPLTDTGTVTVSIYDKVWYVKQGSAGTGTSSNPLGSFTGINGAGGAGDGDAAGDYIFVHNSASLTSSIELEANQHLLGEGVGLSINRNLNGNGAPTNLVAAGTKPPVTSATDTVKITAAMPVEVRGLSLASTAGNAIDVTTTAALSGSSTLTIANNDITAASAEGLDLNLNAGTTGTLNVAVNSNNVTATGNGIDLARVAGNLTITGLNNNVIGANTGGNGIVITGQATFDSDTGTAGNQTVNGGNTSIGVSGNGVGGSGLSMSTVTGTLSFTDLDIFADGGSGLSASGSGSFSISVAANQGTIEAIGGPAVSVTGGAIDLQLAGLKSTNSATTGVNLNTTSGTFSAPSGATITNATGTDFAMTADTSAVTYNGTITDDVGVLVSTSGACGGTKAFTGAITDGDDADGSGVSLAGSGATVRFSGGLVLSTAANPAFAATAGTVEVCDENPCNNGATGALINKITTTTGTALNVSGASIGANNLEFRSITAGTAASGPASGIILSGTGASGGLKVKGTGAANSGGIIQKTTSYGVSLTNTENVEFNRFSIHDTGDRGINGSGVNNFIYRDSTVFNFDNGAHGPGATVDAMTFTNLTGTVTIQRSTLGPDGQFVLSSFPPLPENKGIIVRNTNVANLNMTVTGSTFTQLSNDGIDAEVTGGTGTINVDGSTGDGANVFNQINGRGVNFGAPVDNASARVLDLTVKNNTFTTVAIGGRWFVPARTTMNARYNANTMTGTSNDAFRSESDATNGALTPHATINATINGNAMGGGGAFISTHRSSITNLALTNNTGMGFAGINVFSDRGSTTGLDITGNAVSVNGASPNFRNAMYLQTSANGGGASTICAKITGNTLTSTGATSAGLVLDTVNGEGTIGLEGYVSGAEEAYLTSVNTITGSPQVAIDNAAFVGVGGDCVTSTP
jgi:VCBS repeat-containing protein